VAAPYVFRRTVSYELSALFYSANLGPLFTSSRILSFASATMESKELHRLEALHFFFVRHCLPPGFFSRAQRRKENRSRCLLGDNVLKGQMRRIRRIAIISTTTSALALLFISNTALALFPVAPNGIRPPCVPVFEVPFTDYSFQLPLWMWGLVPFSVLVLSTLAAITCWIVLLFKWRAKVRKAAAQ